MWVEQAVYTSLSRNGKSGYHLVARSPGVTEADARLITSWSPSQGALIVDRNNRTSLNYYPLSEGRFALSRSCEGPPEYSGRGGRVLYTHTLVLHREHLEIVNGQPIALYRDAMALGHLHFRPNPKPTLDPVELSDHYPARSPRDDDTLADLFGPDGPSPILRQLTAGRSVEVRHSGNRITFVEALIDLLPGEAVYGLSFSTGLRPSASREYTLRVLSTDESNEREPTARSRPL